MNSTDVSCEELLLALAECYEHDPGQFIPLSKRTVDSVCVREIVATSAETPDVAALDILHQYASLKT